MQTVTYDDADVYKHLIMNKIVLLIKWMYANRIIQKLIQDFKCSQNDLHMHIKETELAKIY